MTATAVLVHGAWHGAWCFDRVLPLLEQAGVPALAIDLPGHGADPGPFTDLHGDADHVRAVLDTIDGPVVLLGHSYGGAVVTDAGSHPNVEHVVYLTAFALDEGESITANALTGGEEMTLGEAMEFDGDVVSIQPGRVVEFFFHDCTDDVAAGAMARLRPQSMPAFTGVPRAVAWREKPATYVVCTDDR